MLSENQFQDNIHKLRVLVQSFGTGNITVSVLIGGYGILKMIFSEKCVHFTITNRNDCYFKSMFNYVYLYMFAHCMVSSKL